jgi:hypothetical protein
VIAVIFLLESMFHPKALPLAVAMPAAEAWQ